MNERRPQVESSSDSPSLLDAEDPLRSFRDEFHFPRDATGREQVYLVGNSLGLQPKQVAAYIKEELDAWRELAVRGHFSGSHPWMPYHEFLSEPMASLIGAYSDEVVMMNSLTVNLHLMLSTFYRPRGGRKKILIEAGAFPSDHFAVESHLRVRGVDPGEGMLVIAPRSGRETLAMDDVCQCIETHRDELALVMLPAVQYYTGQVLDLRRIAAVCHRWDIVAGFDLAHAAGNIELELHEWEVDFAVWCSYKYLNSGPGSVGGCFIHRRHAQDATLPRLAGWWGHDKATRFAMHTEFQAMPAAEGWQLSNPPILSLAAIRASLDVFQRAGGMAPLARKSRLMTGWLREAIDRRFGGAVHIVTPPDGGCQLSLRVVSSHTDGRAVKRHLDRAGIETDWREPNVIRAAPVPLYNRFADCERFVDVLDEALGKGE